MLADVFVLLLSYRSENDAKRAHWHYKEDYTHGWWLQA
jgi:hypothetical protein